MPAGRAALRPPGVENGLKVRQASCCLRDLRYADLQLHLEDMRPHTLQNTYALRGHAHAVALEACVEPQLIHEGEGSVTS